METENCLFLPIVRPEPLWTMGSGCTISQPKSRTAQSITVPLAQTDPNTQKLIKKQRQKLHGPEQLLGSGKDANQSNLGANKNHKDTEVDPT
jgi:hypothetical protein